MKRKVLCLAFALLMVFSLAACGDKNKEAADSGKSDMDRFMEMQQNMQDVKDAEFKLTTDMDVSGSDAVSLKMKGTVKEVIKSKDDIEMEFQYSMTVPNLGTDLKGTMYMKDNIVYTDLMGQKMKMDARDEMAAAMNINGQELLSLTEDMISDLKVSKEGSDTVYTCILDMKKAAAYFDNYMSSVSNFDNSDQVSYDTMKMTVSADEKNMAKRIDVSSAISAEAGEESAKVSYTVSIEYVSVNTGLKIKFPSFKGYQDVSV